MSRAVTLRLLPCCLLLATLTGCQQSGLKLPKFKGKDKPAPSETTDASAAAPVPARTPEESAFLGKCATLGATSMTIAGLDGYFFSANELQRLATLSDPANTSLRTATAAIADYRDQLKRQGTELIFVPVPPKAIIFPDKIDKDLKIKIKGKRPARLDSALQATYAALRAKGVRVIDPTDALLATRENKKLGPVFPRTAPVWSPRGAEVAAREIAQTLKGAPWANQSNKDGPLITEASVLNYAGTLTTGTAVTEALALRNIGRSADGKMRSVTFSQGGHPLALIGDHTILAWREANNPAGATDAFASLADQLAFEFQTTPDVFPGKTDGRNAARLRILREATNGSNPVGSAKVVLWVVQATDLALSDWKQVPLRLSFNLSQPPVMLTPPVGLIPDSSSPPRPPGPPAAPGPAPSSGDPALPQLPR
jgi:alginate O-acetyltransferase complex protein AlgJ